MRDFGHSRFFSHFCESYPFHFSCLYMRRLHTFLLLLLSFSGAYAAKLIWPDLPDGRLYQIDTQQQTLSYEGQNGVWQLVGKIQLVDVVESDIPPIVRVKAIEIDNKQSRYLLLDCTQQVYHFSFVSRKLERLDHSYYRGYNCYAAKFLRRDTLYSFGGYGFWHTNGLQTFFKKATREWEGLSPVAPGPASICFGFNGYLSDQDQFLAAFSLQQHDTQRPDPVNWDQGVYLYSFRPNTWEKVGQISEAIRNHIKPDLINRLSWFQAGNYFILKHFERPYATLLIVDAVRNEARLWSDSPRLLTGVEDNSEANIYRSYVWRDTLYFHVMASNKSAKPIVVSKMPVNEIWLKAKPIGRFYDAETNRYSKGALVAFSALLVIGLLGRVVWRRQRSTSLKADDQIPEVTKSSFDWLPFTQQEKNVLTDLAETEDDSFTNEKLHSLLNIDDKTPDNQRKIRADFLKSLNSKLKVMFHIDDAVQRIPTSLDRRMYYYKLHTDITEKVLGKSKP